MWQMKVEGWLGRWQMKWAEICFGLIQAIRREPFVFQRPAGAFTTGFSIFNVRTHNFWSVKIQAPVWFEWAVKLSVLLPVSNYSEHLCLPLQFAKAFLQLSIHLTLTTPCSDPGAGLLPPRGTEAVKRPFRFGPHDTFAPPVPLVS